MATVGRGKNKNKGEKWPGAMIKTGYIQGKKENEGQAESVITGERERR